MVRDDDLLTDGFLETLGDAAEPLGASTRRHIRARVMRGIRTHDGSGFSMLASHRVAAAVTALSVLGAGVAYATERSLPGDPLYDVKIAAENTAVSILPPGQMEYRLLVRIAARRARETATLAREGSEPEAVDCALGALREAVRQATPAEGTLGEAEVHRIREQGADAPVETREAIDDVILAPLEPTGSHDGGTGDGGGMNDQSGTGGGGSTEETIQGPGGTGERTPGIDGGTPMAGSSCETSEGPRLH